MALLRALQCCSAARRVSCALGQRRLHARVGLEAASLSTSRVEVDAAATPECADLPHVDYSTVSGGEAASAAGRVITAQANYMRVLVRWEDLTQSQRAARGVQLQVRTRLRAR